MAIIQMTKTEYEKKYGEAPPISDTPILKMTRAEYETKYGVPPIQQEPGFFQRVGAEFSKIGQELIPEIQKGAEIIQKGTPLEALGTAARVGLRTVGSVARGVFAPIFEAPGIKQITEKVAQKITQIPGANELIKSATDLAIKYPESAKDLRDVVDVATLGVGGALKKPILREVGAIGQDIAKGAKIILTPSEEAIQKKILTLFQKSIKPTAKKTLGQGEKYNADTLNALRTIKANVEKLNIEEIGGELISGRTPQTINELAQGLDQTKQIIFSQYDNLAKEAGTAGATIDAKLIADEVGKVAQNKALQLANPSIIDYAKGWEERLRKFDVLDAETTQEVVKLMNTNLQAFYRNPTYDAASKVTVDAGIANNFRQALDKAIEGATGEQYQILKRQYGALKAIENDVVRATMRDARKNTKGLLDYTDMFTGGQMVGGILSLNPAMFTKGAVERGFKEYIKFLNDPNRAISNIFEKLNIDTTKIFEPVSITGQALKNPNIGMTIQDVTKTLKTSASINKEIEPLAAEARKYKSAEEFVKAQGTNNPLLETAKDFENADDFISFYRGSSTQYGKYKPELRKFGTTEESVRVPELGVDPEKKITIYRGIDTVQGGKMRGSINDGDFVTTDFDAANAYTGGKVVSKEVKAKDLILDYPEKSDFENPFYKGAEFIYSDSKNAIIKRSEADLRKIFDEAKSYQIKIPITKWEKQAAYIQKYGKIPDGADLKGYSKSPEYNKYGTTERQRLSSYYEYVSNKIDEANQTKSQLTDLWNKEVGGNVPLRK